MMQWPQKRVPTHGLLEQSKHQDCSEFRPQMSCMSRAGQFLFLRHTEGKNKLRTTSRQSQSKLSKTNIGRSGSQALLFIWH